MRCCLFSPGVHVQGEEGIHPDTVLALEDDKMKEAGLSGRKVCHHLLKGFFFCQAVSEWQCQLLLIRCKRLPHSFASTHP